MNLYAETVEKASYDAKDRRDPFVPLVTTVANRTVIGLNGVLGVEDIQLEGVVVDPAQGSIAIANGVVLREGETQEGVKVLKIDQDGVTFEIKGKVQFKPFSAELSEVNK